MATKLPDIIGLPPDSSLAVEKNEIFNTMPVAEIYPCEQNFTTGAATFQLKLSDKYFELLEDHGFSSTHNNSIKVAFLADSFPTDNFQNNYSESFLQNISSGISQGASTLMQTMGARTGTEGFNKLMDASGTLMHEIGFDSASKFLSGAKNTANKIAKSLSNHANDSGPLGRVASSLNTVLGGSRFDFPMIWTDSSFQPSYTMTVRLYNPNPADEKTTYKYIIGPIAALLLLGIPISVDNTGSTYSYPFLHKIKCAGIYFLNPCFISNISIIKGGDQQQIAFNQRLGIVDVRIDFGSLFSSLLATKEWNYNRPTLKSYLKAMENQKYLKHEEIFVEPGEEEEEESFEPETLPSDLTPDIPETESDKEYYIMDAWIGELGSLSKAVDAGIKLTKGTAKKLYENDVVTEEEIREFFPDIELPEKPVKSLEVIQQAAKSVISNTSKVGAAAASLAQNTADLYGFHSQLEEIMNNVEGDIIPPIYFNGELVANSMTKFQLNKFMDNIKDQADSMMSSVSDSISKIGTEALHLNSLSSSFNNIPGITRFLSKSLNFSSYTDLMDNILHPGNIIDNAKDILGDMLHSNLKFNANNLLGGIVDGITDKVQQMDLLNSIIDKGFDFAGRLDIVDMIKNGVAFDVKNVLSDIAMNTINNQASNIVDLVMGGNYNFNATNALRQVMSAGNTLRDTFDITRNLKNTVADIRDTAMAAGTGVVRDLASDLSHSLLDNVKNIVKGSAGNLNIKPNDLMNKLGNTATNELNKGKEFVNDFIHKQVSTILI